MPNTLVNSTDSDQNSISPLVQITENVPQNDALGSCDMVLSSNERMKELEEENTLLFEQVHALQEELEKNYHALQQSGVKNTADCIIPHDHNILTELAVLRRRFQALRTLMQEVWRLRSDEQVTVSAPQKIITEALLAWAAGGADSVASLLKKKGLPQSEQAEAWRELCQRFEAKGKGLSNAMECAKRAYALQPDPWRMKTWAKLIAASNTSLNIADALFSVLPLEVNLTEEDKKNVSDFLGKEPLPKDLKKLRSDSEAKGEELRKIHKDFDVYKGKLAQTQADLDTSKADLEASRKELAEAQSQNEIIKNELAQTQAELDTSKAELDASRKELEEAQSQNEIIKNELAQTQTEFDISKAELDASRKELEEAQSQNETIKNDLAQTQAELDTSKADLDASRKELAEAQSQNETLKNDLSQTQTELDTSKADLDASRSEIESLKEELCASKALAEADREELKKITNEYIQIHDTIKQHDEKNSKSIANLFNNFKKEMDNVLRQSVAYAGLATIYDTGRLPRVKPWGRGWPASPDFILLQVEMIFKNEYDVIIEFGSGYTTLHTANALDILEKQNRKIPVAVTFDHLEEFQQKTISLLQEEGLENKVNVIYAPLQEYVTPDGVTYQYYSCQDTLATLSEKYNKDVEKMLVIVDGPPAATGKDARYPAFPIIMQHFSCKSVHFLLDDMIRDDEKEIMQSWLNTCSLAGLKHAFVDGNLEKFGTVLKVFRK